MAIDFDIDDDAPASGDFRALESGAALGLALAVASREKADAFLDAQTDIARLQKEHLHEQRGLVFGHLEWQGFSDLMRAGWQVVLAVLGLIAFIAILTALWNASRADGLIVDAFSVAPSFEQRGIGGDVVAGDITGKLADIRAAAIANSYSLSRDVTSDREKEIKVEIPDTGVSIAEVWKYLRQWLGHERHVAGNLRENGDGTITLTASLDGGGTISASGRASELAALEQSVAEKIFATFDPVNGINYLTASGRHRDAYLAAQRFVPMARTLLERSDSYALLGYTGATATGDLEQAVARARAGIAIDPSVAVVHIMAMRYSHLLGRDETAVAESRAILSLHNEDQPLAHQTGGFESMKAQAAALTATLEGDFAHSVNSNCARGCRIVGTMVSQSEAFAQMHDPRAAGTLLAQALAIGSPDPGSVEEARLAIAGDTGAWDAAIVAGKAAWVSALAPSTDTSPRYLAQEAAVEVLPSLALAQAHAGHFSEALASIGKTPADCVPCNTARGEIDRLEGDTDGAASWFARADGEAPSIPFADTDWGAMLLARGDLDGAIAKFAAANEKGPHFADPLELWGEALVAKRRSDLAVAKFADAAADTPNWGRLHLKWGEALLWSGDKDGARKQFALAAQLFLTPSEQTELARVRGAHG